IAVSLWLAQQAERLAYRRRFGVMADYAEHVVSHAPSHLSAKESKKQADAFMKILLRGSDQLFFIWLNFFRDHLIAALILVLGFIFALSMNVAAALLLVILTGIFVALNVYILRHGFDEQTKFEKFHTHIAERTGGVMNNAAVIQSYTRLSAEIGSLRQAMQHVVNAQGPVINWWARKSALMRCAATVFLVLIFNLGSYFYNEGRIDLRDVIALGGLALLFLFSAERLTDFVNVLLVDEAAVSDLLQSFGIEDESKADIGAPELDASSMQIEFRNVTFGEDGEISFTIKPGETVAFLEKDGDVSAKLSAALMRTLEVQGGEILINGQDIAKVSRASLRKNISYISRDSGLLHRSVMENLMLGNWQATQDDVIAAVRQAEAHDFIAAKRDGFHTFISDHGQDFSDEERRQLLIARAFLKNAPLVIYEDGDVSDNKKLARAVDNLMKNRTSIIITGNPAIADKAKRTFAFENGALAGAEKTAKPKKPAAKETAEAE
ncbi:MAG: ATP-binding cassette domain-containing protein, partial [Pseudomonadota bacterium]